MFSYQSRQGYFRLVRRAGRWFIEFEGLVSRTFDTAEAAAQSLARGQAGLPVPISHPPPERIDHWQRGDLPPLWPPAPASSRPRIVER